MAIQNKGIDLGPGNLVTGNMGSIPGPRKSLEKENSNPLLYSCLGNPMDGGAWWATVHGVAKELDITATK